MLGRLFTFLRSYSTDPEAVDRLIVSSFLYGRNIRTVRNNHLFSLLIKEGDEDFSALKRFISIQAVENFEQLIELFEFVVSPKDKVINGAIYTPKNIREYIVRQSMASANLDLRNVKVYDPACGCAGFLLTCAKLLKDETGRTYKQIFRDQLYGLDIEEYSIERSRTLLSLLAISEGEDDDLYHFNLFEGNALSFSWSYELKEFEGFDVVIGNPPYVCSRNMDQESLDLMDRWEVTKTGHPDLYIPFFQLGLESLKNHGILGFITVNTFLRSVNGRALRKYFSRKKVDLRIINFGGEQIFRNRSTYTCICFLMSQEGSVRYKKASSLDLNFIENSSFVEYSYENLHDYDGWNLVDSQEQIHFVNKIEATGRPFKEIYDTRNGIATLRNDIYKFDPTGDDDRFFFLKTKLGSSYKIEKDVCRDIVNPNKARSTEEITANNEKIIYPYYQKGGRATILDEEVFMEQYPKAYEYLSDHKEALGKRDKGKRIYEKWYAYGRRQSLELDTYKLFIPHLSERPTFTISTDRKLLFYSGIAVVSDSLRELNVLKRILESDLFFNYIKCITKDYSSGYISMSRNYIKNFGVYELTEDEKDSLLETNDPENVLRRLYGLSEPNRRASQQIVQVAEPNPLLH